MRTSDALLGARFKVSLSAKARYIMAKEDRALLEALPLKCYACAVKKHGSYERSMKGRGSMWNSVERCVRLPVANCVHCA